MTGAAARSLVEVRLLDGPNLYFPRPAAKVTLDIGALLELDLAQAQRFAADVGLTPVAARARGLGVPAAVRRPGGRPSRPAARARRWGASDWPYGRGPAPTSPSWWWPTRGATRRGPRCWPTGWPRCWTPSETGTGPTSRAVLQRAAERLAATPPGSAPQLIKPRIPVVAVTGTNGKTTTSRMLGFIAQRAGLSVGWSSTDGVYLNGELVEAGDYSGPSGAGQVLRQPGVRAGGHRDRPWRDPATRGRGGLERRVRGDQHQRRPPRHRWHRDPRPAGRGEGGDHQDHPADRLVRAERGRPPDVRHATGHQGPGLGVHPRPELAGRPCGDRRPWSGDHGDRRLGGGPAARRRTRCRSCRWSTWG